MYKICLVLDSSNLSTFYVYTLMREYLKSKDIELDIFLNPCKTTLGISARDLIDSEYNESIYSHVTVGVPSSKNYDTLFFSNLRNKKGSCISSGLIESFTNKGKLAMSIKCSSCLSSTSWPVKIGTSAPIIYGIPFQNLGFTNCVEELVKTVDKSCMFHMNNLEIYKHEKPFYLSREEFYNKYKLKDNLKILSFFPSGMHGHPEHKIEHKLHQKLEEINTLAEEMGYQIVCKLHFNEYFGHKSHFYNGQRSSDYYFKKIPAISAEDAYELIKYSSFSLTSSTSMTFEHYLYDLPTINVGILDEFKRNHSFVSFYKDNPSLNFKDLIFGDLYSGADFFGDPEKCFGLSFSKTHDIHSFKAKEDHNVFGDAYHETVETACDNLLTVITNRKNAGA